MIIERREMCSMISGLFYYMVTIFNIIFPFHILLERFSHRTFSPSFYRRLWIFYAVLLSWMIFVPTSTSATFTAFFSKKFMAFFAHARSLFFRANAQKKSGIIGAIKKISLNLLNSNLLKFYLYFLYFLLT